MPLKKEQIVRKCYDIRGAAWGFISNSAYRLYHQTDKKKMRAGIYYRISTEDKQSLDSRILYERRQV